MRKRILQILSALFLYTRGKKNVLGKNATDMLHFIEESTTVNAAASSDCQTIMNMVDRIKVQREVGVRYMKACELEDLYRKEGLEKGIAGIISMGRKYNLTDDEILSELQAEMGLTLEKAQEYLASKPF